MQFIILMYRLKLANFSNAKIDEKLNEIEGSIQAISKTHEILYSHENTNILDSKLYFKDLLTYIEKSFDTQKIKINLNINAILDIEKLILCGIILNELITNALKYAFLNQLGTINITLITKNKQHYFCIEDNGIGFDYEKKKGDSFGLEFIKNIVQHELKGTFEIYYNKGTRIVIRF